MKTTEKNLIAEAVDATGPKPLLTEKRPKIILLLALLFFLIGYLFTKENLINIGIMKTSLTRVIPSIRNLAHLFINYMQLALFFLSASSGIVFLFWRQIQSHKSIQSILKHQALYPRTQVTLTTTFNYSFFTIFFLVFVSLLYVTLFRYVFSKPVQEIIIREDGIVEWMTASAFLICSIIAATNVRISPNIQYKIFLLLFSIFSFLCFGEEISWGQRIFGFETPEAIKQINIQNEFNVHNSFGNIFESIFLLGVFTYGCIMPLLSLYHPFWHRLFDKAGIPVASTGLAIGFFLSLLYSKPFFLLFYSEWSFHSDEIREFLFSMCFLLLMLEARNFFSLRTAQGYTSASFKHNP